MEKYTEMEYREAAQIWRKDNPTVNKIPNNTKIIISSGREIPLGLRMKTMRRFPKRLSEEQKDYWSSFGLCAEKKASYTDEEYMEAAQIWRKDNPLADRIPVSEVIKIKSGKEIPLGCKFQHVLNSFDSLTDKQKKDWYPFGLSKKRIRYTEEEYREAAVIWRKDNLDVSLIPLSAKIIISSGREIPLGVRMSNMRCRLNSLTEEQKEFWKDYGLFNEKVIREVYEEAEYKEAAIIWRKNNPDKDMIPTDTKIVISSGRMIPLGSRFNDMRNHLERLNSEQLKFWKKYGLFYEVRRRKNFDSLQHYAQMFDGDLKKARRVIDCLNDVENQEEKQVLEDILKKFNIDVDVLVSCLEKIKEDKYKNNEFVIELNQTLEQCCIINNCDYEIVNRAIKLHEFCEYDTFEQLINRSLMIKNDKSIRNVSSWIFEKYGRAIKSILRFLNLSAVKVFNDMISNTISLEVAIGRNIFDELVEDRQDKWMKDLFVHLVEVYSKDEGQNIVEILVNYSRKYELTNDEYRLLLKLLEKYNLIIRDYRKVEVGIEANQDKKIELIKKYSLDEFEIEESFFIILDLKKEDLLGRQVGLYERRHLLRQYILDWDYYSDLEKRDIIMKHRFTEKEVNYINKMRLKINDTIEVAKIKSLGSLS